MTTSQSEMYIGVVESFSQVMEPVKTFSVSHWSLLIKQLFLEREIQVAPHSHRQCKCTGARQWHGRYAPDRTVHRL